MFENKIFTLLNGRDQYINCGSMMSGITGAFAIEILAMPTDSHGVDGALISKADDTTGNTKDMFQIEIKSTGVPGGTGVDIVAYVYDNNTQGGIGKRFNNVPVNKFYHIVFTYDGGNNSETSVDLIVNGERETVNDYNFGSFTSINNTDADFLIGSYTNESGAKGRFFAGYVSQLRIYNTHLSIAQARELYNYGTSIDPTKSSFSNNLTNWMPLGEGFDSVSYFSDRITANPMTATGGTGVNLNPDAITSITR